MFPTIYNREYLLDIDGKVVKTPITKDVKLPEMPPLIYISDSECKLCMDTNRTLYSFNKDNLIPIIEGVKQVVQYRDIAYVCTFTNELYVYYSKIEEFKLLRSDASYILTLYNVYFQMKNIVITSEGNAHMLALEEDTNTTDVNLIGIFFPLFNNIKLIRHGCIITDDNIVFAYLIEKNNLVSFRIVAPDNISDICLHSCRNSNIHTLYAMTNCSKLYRNVIGTMDSFIQINNAIIDDIGIVQFICFSYYNGILLQTRKGYIVSYINGKLEPEINLLPKSYIPPFNQNRYEKTKKCIV